MTGKLALKALILESVGEAFRAVRYVSPITLPFAFNSHPTGA
ncbi:hypothetical protein [Mesorhizobium sp.]|nr:hypothetical protein [Mesorhizobium sp.]